MNVPNGRDTTERRGAPAAVQGLLNQVGYRAMTRDGCELSCWSALETIYGLHITRFGEPNAGDPSA